MALKSPIGNILKTKLYHLLVFGKEDGDDTSRFLLKTILWIMIFRMALITWAILFPDSKGFSSFIDVQIPSLSLGLPQNDAFFYWIISKYGFIPTQPVFGVDYGWRFVNFSPIIPLLFMASNPIFQEFSPFLLNSLFLAITPVFLHGFLRNIIHDKKKARFLTIAIILNPVFITYSTYGLTEPLHYLLLFLVLNAHYHKSKLFRLMEYAGLILLVLNRFIGVVLAVFYLYKLVFSKGISIKERVLKIIPVLILGGTYLGYEFLCNIIFGHTPSEARGVYWGHYLNLNIFSPEFLQQIPLLLAGVSLGVATLLSLVNKDKDIISMEKKSFNRIDVQACMAFAAIFFLFLGLFNSQISVFRYMGTLFPLIMVGFIKIPTSKFYSIGAFGIYLGMIITHIIMFPQIILVLQTDWGIILTGIEIFLVFSTSIAFVILNIIICLKQGKMQNMNKLVGYLFLLAVLLMPLSMYYP